jgi:hypothetical protein
MNRNQSPDYRALADLLPFYVTGKLPFDDVQRIEHALLEDAALRLELDLVEEEQIVTVQANEMRGLPSATSAQRFFDALEAEPAHAAAHEAAAPLATARGGTTRAATARSATARSLFAWIGERLQTLTARQMAFAGVAAALLLVVQAGLIGTLLGKGRSLFGTASAPEEGAAALIEGNYAMIAFMPDAKVTDMARVLEASHLRVMDGPRAGGFFRVWIGPKDMPQADQNEIIARLQAEKGVIRFAAPSQSQ